MNKVSVGAELEQVARRIAETIDVNQRVVALGVPSLTKIILSALQVEEKKDLPCQFCGREIVSRRCDHCGIIPPILPTGTKGEPTTKSVSNSNELVVPANAQNVESTVPNGASTPLPKFSKREHVLQSAGYWFESSRRAQAEGKSAEAVMCMENAYNHVENALVAARAQLLAESTGSVVSQDTQRLDWVLNWLGDHEYVKDFPTRDWIDNEDARDVIDKAMRVPSLEPVTQKEKEKI